MLSVNSARSQLLPGPSEESTDDADFVAAESPFTVALKAHAHPVVTDGEASLRTTVLNAVNAIIGAGIIALPYAMYLDGGVLGIAMITAVALLSERSAAMLLWCADVTDMRLYSEIGAQVGGKWLGSLVDITVVLQNIGLNTGYAVVVGDLLPEFVAFARGQTDEGEGPQNPNWQGRAIILALTALIVFFPLSALPNLNALRFTTLVGLVFVVVLLVVCGVYAFMTLENPSTVPCSATRGEFQWAPQSFLGALQAAPLLFFAFVAHNTFLLLYGELKRKSRLERDSRWPTKFSKMMHAIRVSLAVCWLIYLLSALFGYSMFRAATAQDVFRDFGPRAFPFMAWMKLAYGVVVMLSYPIIAYALRRSLHNLVWGSTEPATTSRRITLAAAIVGVSTIVAIFVPQISTIFGLTGALTSSNIMYIFPSLFFLVISRRQAAAGRGPPPPSSYTFWAWVSLLLGLFVFVGCSIGVIIGIANPRPDNSCGQP
jgi:solute carrier family 38 (sodium-coupled neutral amino acid transporter), member 6